MRLRSINLTKNSDSENSVSDYSKYGQKLHSVN